MAKKTILGIDIGYDQLKLALVSGGEVVSTAMEQMPENLLKEGRFTSPELMASLIRDTMNDNGMKASLAAVVLPNELVYVKTVDMPKMSEEQLSYNLPFEFNDYITGEIKDYLFDYAVLKKDDENDLGGFSVPAESVEAGEETEETMHLMAVGVERAVVEDIQIMLRKASLKLVKTAPALSAYISLLRETQIGLDNGRDEYAILDIGYHNITMYMFKHDQHIATREFEVGLQSLEDIIVDKYGVEKHLAHTYVMSNFENCLESEECLNFYDNISVEMERAINFYEFSNQGSNLADLWICGGGAVNEPLLRSIYETLDLDLHPSYELLPGGRDIENYNSYVQAIGVTLEL